VSLTEEFLAFCRSKPAEEVYDFTDPEGCAVAQFGYPGLPSSDIDAKFGAEFANTLASLPNTFGALTARLEALAEQVPA
jgi:hypothetical protein